MKEATDISKIVTELIEINVGAIPAKSQNFGQQPNIRDNAVRIIAIEAFNIAQVEKSPENQDLISASVMRRTTLELFDKATGTNRIRQYPLSKLSVLNGVTEVKNINCPAVDFEKCKLTVPDAAILTANTSYLFLITYEKK